MVTAGYGLETSDGVGRTMGNEGLEGSGSEGLELGWYLPYPVGFQASLTAFLLLELVLGLGSNLTVLVLYCAQCSLVDSVSNLVTANLHVVDVVVCAVCLPLTTALVLLPPGRDPAQLCRLHEACVAFAGVATAANVLVVSVDRYDISVRPACRLLTPRRAALLLATVWASSLAAAALPFLEAEADRLTLLCLGRGGGRAERAVYYHLVLQVPVFLAAAIVMLVTYAKILRALNIRIGSRTRTSKRFRGPTCAGRRRRRKRKNPGDGGEPSSVHDKPLSPPPLIPSATPTATSPPPLSSAPMGVGASVSAIIALRRAVRRHRDRRERRRRVLRMSLIIVCSFLGCWVPLMAADVLVLSLGPGERLARLRLCLLVLAYGTTVFHPLLYAFTRQKLRRALRAKVKRRVVTLLQVDPAPGSAPVHNSWVEPRQGRKPRQEGSDATDRCLTETVKE